MKKIVLILLITNLFASFVIQSEDCNLKEFLKTDHMKELLKKHDITRNDIGIFVTDSIYEAANKLMGLQKYNECKMIEKSEKELEKAKQYKDKTIKNGSGNSDQLNNTDRKIRSSEAMLFEHSNSSTGSTLEFEELKKATNEFDHCANKVVKYDRHDSMYSYYLKDLRIADRRRKNAIRDFEETTKTSNPFMPGIGDEILEKDRSYHHAQYETLKQYQTKTAKNQPYNARQGKETYRELRGEEEYLFKLKNEDKANTREFKELKDAVDASDWQSAWLQECTSQHGAPGIIFDECASTRKNWKRANRRKENAIKDFEETTKEKNPFVVE